jgi:thiosulfate/3-mercaptopyruvate sulfurtransferase
MSYTNADALVSTDWVAEHLDDPSIRLIEVDEDVDAYQKGHIQGAVAWNWFSDLHHPVRRDYVDQEGLSELLSKAGVGPDTTVVFYGANNNWFAAYAYWLAKYLGYEQVKLLNGGRKKWEQESRPFTQDLPDYQPTGFKLSGRIRPELRALRDEVLAKVGTAAFIDVRSPQEFTGEKLAPDHLPQEQPYVGGHVPGALNIPWAQAANEDGTFKSTDELRSLYAGVTSDGEVITYCRIGERSSHTWFALTQLLGLTGVKNYDGSWTEYGSLVGVPVEKG